MTHDNQKLALLTGAAGVLGSEAARSLALPNATGEVLQACLEVAKENRR